jgi:hypothetical protein
MRSLDRNIEIHGEPWEQLSIGVLTASMTNTKVVWLNNDERDKMWTQGSYWRSIPALGMAGPEKLENRSVMTKKKG